MASQCRGPSDTSSGCFFVGIWTNPTFSGTQGGHQILNNIVQNNISGIELDSTCIADPTLVQFNLIRNNNNPGPGSGNGIETVFGLCDATIDSNEFSGHTSSSIVIEAASSGLAVSSNELDGGTNEGFAFAFVSSSTLTGNTSIASTSSGTIDLFGGDSDITISGNLLGFGQSAIVVENPYSVGANSLIQAHNNCLEDNQVAGLNVPSGGYTGTLDATNNWWGAASGPTIASNSGGMGDEIIDAGAVVTYSPFLATSPCAPPAVVNTTNDDTISGDHLCTLREAINNANAGSDSTGGDCAVSSAITFSVSGTITLGSSLPAIASDVTIDGVGQSIVVDGANIYQVMLVNSGAALSSKNLTVARGKTASQGAGIINQGTLDIQNVTFSGNSASGNGGAIYNDVGGSLTVTNSSFSTNSAATGAGIFNNGGTLTVSNSAFTTNTSPGDGGGIYSTNNGTATSAAARSRATAARPVGL